MSFIYKDIDYSEYYMEAYEHVRFLAEDCGVRVAGKENVLKASEYIQNKFSEYGVDVMLHKFEIPVCDIESSSLTVRIDGKEIEMDHKPAIFSKPTGDEIVKGKLVYIENGSIGNVKMEEVKDKFVLICRDVYVEYPDLNMYKKLHEYGVKGILYTTSDGHRDIPYVYANFAKMDEDYTIPTAVVLYDEAMKLLGHEDVEISYSYRCKIHVEQTQNTIGYVEGSDKNAGNIIICAHLDSAEGSKGALDDGGGIAVMMQMAKLYGELLKKGVQPKRSLYFIAWSGHECGIYGSRYFIESYPEIFEQNKFVFNYDIIGNALSSPLIWAGCNEKVEEKLNEIVDGLGFEWKVDVGPWIVDTINFAKNQIPHITLTSGFYSENHTKYDNMDYVSLESFKTPVIFSVALMDWLVNTDSISQGYDEKLAKSMEFYGKMYGWGFFE